MVVGNDDLIERVRGYVDGFNVYNGLMDRGWGRFRWLNHYALVEHLLRDGQQVEGVALFTSLMNHEPAKLVRQKEYLLALGRSTPLEVIPGEFKKVSSKCRGECGEWYKRPQEKKTDVNIAVRLVCDAAGDRFDTAFLISGDSDLVAAVEAVRQEYGKKVVIVDPPKRHSNDLHDVADGYLHLSKTLFSRSQLPNPVVYQSRKGNDMRVDRPAGWG